MAYTVGWKFRKEESQTVIKRLAPMDMLEKTAEEREISGRV